MSLQFASFDYCIDTMNPIQPIAPAPRVTRPLVGVPDSKTLHTAHYEQSISSFQAGNSNKTVIVSLSNALVSASGEFANSMAAGGLTIAGMDIKIYAKASYLGKTSGEIVQSAFEPAAGLTRRNQDFIEYPGTDESIPVQVSLGESYVGHPAIPNQPGQVSARGADNRFLDSYDTTSLQEAQLGATSPRTNMFSGTVNQSTGLLNLSVPTCTIRTQGQQGTFMFISIPSVAAEVVDVNGNVTVDEERDNIRLTVGFSIDVVWYDGFAQTEMMKVKLNSIGKWEVERSTIPTPIETVEDGFYWPVPWKFRLTSRYGLWGNPSAYKLLRRGIVPTPAEWSHGDNLVLYDPKYTGDPWNQATATKSPHVKRKKKTSVSKKKKKSKK